MNTERAERSLSSILAETQDRACGLLSQINRLESSLAPCPPAANGGEKVVHSDGILGRAAAAARALESAQAMLARVLDMIGLADPCAKDCPPEPVAAQGMQAYSRR